MRVNPILLAIGMSVGFSVPALAQSAPFVVADHHGKGCETDCKHTCGEGCADGKACPHKGGAACKHDQAKEQKDCCEKKEACCDKDEACCDEGDACEHHDKGDHGDKGDACEHDDKGGMGSHDRMGGRRHGGGMSVGVRNFWNQANGGSYLGFTMDKLWGYPRTGQTWFNPGAGMGWSFAIDPSNQTVNRHFLMGGPMLQNAMVFGPVNVTLGLQAGLGCVFDTTQTLNFQNANHFYALDPRLSVGWQMTPRAALSLTGSYLFTTRPTAAGGPTAGLNMNYRF